MKVNNSLIFDGNAKEALAFYQEALKAELLMLTKYSDTSIDNISDKDLKKICHAELKVTDNFTLMCVDTLLDNFKIGNNHTISLNFTSIDNFETAQNIYNNLSVEAKINIPFEKTFWNAYYANLTDKFGVCWEINYQLPE